MLDVTIGILTSIYTSLHIVYKGKSHTCSSYKRFSPHTEDLVSTYSDRFGHMLSARHRNRLNKKSVIPQDHASRIDNDLSCKNREISASSYAIYWQVLFIAMQQSNRNCISLTAA